MLTVDQIKNMTDEEVAAENTRLARKIIVTKIIVPMATVVAVHVAAHFLAKKFANNANA